MGLPSEIARGIWRWTARHPEWHPGEFGAEVASFALTTDDGLLLIDPLLPDEDGAPVLEALDRLARDRAVNALITIGYHVRSAEQLAERYGGRIYGPPTCRKRLRNTALFADLTPDTPGPAGARAFAIGKPRRTERPLWLPSHAALAFGDAIATTPGGELRMWATNPVDDKRRRFYRDRFAPTLAPLLELPVEHVLVTHGEAVLGDGAEALRAAVDAEPWYHHG
jgi:hypothetical protein